MRTPRTLITGSAVVAMLFACTGLSTQDRGNDLGRAEPLPGAPPPSYDAYKSPLEARVTDRRFDTKEAMFLSSEMHECGFPFFEGALINGLVGSDPEFQYMTTVESYWYSRYNMSALVTESRLGVHTVFGPYVSEWALRSGRANVNRDRGEHVRSNKSTMVQEIIPKYMERTGFPRRFEDASPAMLHYASGDPHYVRPVDKGVAFQSTENVLRESGLRQLYGDAALSAPSGMGTPGNDMWSHRVNYRENFLSLRWDHSNMEHVIDMGAEGQALMKEVLWMEYFFRGSHHRGKYLGNDPEEGFRSCMLNLMAVNKMLMLKGALLYDGERLKGVDPRTFEPGSAYFPHRVAVRLRYTGDLPPRPEEFSVDDASSQLFDQASLLWALSEYYHFADPSVEGNWRKVFGANPRSDDSVMEEKFFVLAEGLANMVLENMLFMHVSDGSVLSSEWLPEAGTGAEISTPDLAMAMIALANYSRQIKTQPERVERARAALATQADFLIKQLQRDDGSVPDVFDHSAQEARPGAPTLLSGGLAVRGLLAAYDVLGTQEYLDGALAAYGFMNSELWDEQTGIYRSHVGADVTVYTPMNIAAALGAMREIILVTENAEEIERFKRFWVQGVNASGIQQAEYEETGERDFYLEDGDGDGIPRIEYAGGEFGMAPVYASEVEIQTPANSVR